MRKLFSILFTIVALLTFSSVASAQDVLSGAKKVETVQWGKTRTASHQKNAAVQKKVAIASKPMLSPTIAAKPKPAKRTTGVKVVYIKTAAPWYTNPLILLLVGGMLLLVGGFIGRILSFGPIPRRDGAEEEETTERESWLKRFLCQFKKPEPAAI